MKTTPSLPYAFLALVAALILGVSLPFSPAQTIPVSEATKNENGDQKGHEQHDSFRDRFAHKNLIVLEKQYSLSPENKTQIKTVIDTYLELKHALARDDASLSDALAKSMQVKLDAVDKTRMEGKGLEAWNQHSTLLHENLEHFQHMGDIEKKRSYFSHISEIAYCTVKSFNIEYEFLYSIFCRNAFSGKGAYWLSTTSEIFNPYLGMNAEDCARSVESLGTSKTLYISPFGRGR